MARDDCAVTSLRACRLFLCAALSALVALAISTAAAAQAPIPPSDLPEKPVGFQVSAREAVRTANADANVAEVSARRGRLEVRVEAKPPENWQVGYFDGEREVVQVHVDSRTGAVRESWTGHQVAWPMARGNEGQFGHALNAWYVWVPLALLFFFGLFDFRRARRPIHLDLLVLLSFGLSHYFFNRGEIGVSVPLVYPPLAYLLVRMLWIAFCGLGKRDGLRPSAPVPLLMVACLFLIAFRVTLNIADSGVIDVGYAGVIGADRITHGEPVYGEGAFPDNNPTGDTYGPANYYTYVPFEALLPWSGEWDALPAAHAAAIFFDLATAFGLFVLGGRLRRGDRRAGRALGTTLAFAWLAYPYTAFALQSNSNDSLVAALLIWGLVLFASPAARGGLVAAAALAKFAPLALAPLYVAGQRGLMDRMRDGAPLRPVAVAILAAIGIGALLIAYPAIDPGLPTLWERTVENQLDRESPFSVWGQVDGLDWLQRAVLAGAAVLALAVALFPARRSVPAIAALAAAVLIALQLAVDHWFYLYLPWFAGLVLVATSRRPAP